MKKYSLTILVLFFSLPVLAAQPYVVENVKVNLKGVNPVEARTQALGAAQVKAFKALFKSLNNGAALEFDESRIPSLIEDFELVDEQIAPDRYAATYTFRFKRVASEELAREAQYASGVAPTASPSSAYGETDYSQNQSSDPRSGSTNFSELYARSGVDMPAGLNNAASYNPGSKAPLLLPYWKTGTNVALWGQENVWASTWQRIETSTEKGRGFALPIGDLADMRETSDRLPEDRAAIQQMMARYQTDRIIVAVGERASSSITTTLYQANGNGGLSFWKVIDSPIGPAADPYSVAAGQIMAEIRGNSNPDRTSAIPVSANRSANSPAGSPQPQNSNEPFFRGVEAPSQSVIRAESRFQTPKEWLRLKASMSPENGISNLKVISLTPRSAMVELQLSEPVYRVQQNLGGRSVALKEHGAGDGSYIVQFMGS